MLQCVAVCCSVLQCVAVCCRHVLPVSFPGGIVVFFMYVLLRYMCCSVLQCVAVVCDKSVF